MRSDTREFAVESLEMLAAPLLWLAHLLTMYGVTGLYCARNLEGLPLVSAAVTLVAFAVLAWLGLSALREVRSQATSPARCFADQVTVALCAFALVGIVWTVAPALLVPSCSE